MMRLTDKVAFLARPEAYPETTSSVDTKETHMSWVFLTDDFAYKLKKPVRTDFLDYGTIAARRESCLREVRLNRRLAPGVYLGVVALRHDVRTGLHLGGGGRAVDWLVKMKRLPVQRTLEYRIAAGRVRRSDIHRLARRLAAYFTSSPKAPIAPNAYLNNIVETIRAHKAELRHPRYALPGDRVDRLAAQQIAFLARSGALLRARAVARMIREGHGDLRPEHVYCNGVPIIMDCLEFNRRLRQLDPMDELSYLAMECERLGDRRLGRWLFAAYRRETGDVPPPVVISFYKCFRAFVRATIAIRHLDDAVVRDPGRWRNRALDYLASAERHARELQGNPRDRSPAGALNPPDRVGPRLNRFRESGGRLRRTTARSEG
jgi:aminoglycoside phosphotransferase family enzyme